MPWKEVKPMEQKILFIADYLREISSFTQLCADYGISRKTGYKWIGRFKENGSEGLIDCKKRPKVSPSKTPYRIEQAIIDLRKQYQTKPGAKKLKVLLARKYPNETLPSKTTIYNILNRAGLVHSRRPRQRVPKYPQPFAPVKEANEVWSVDYKGQFKLRNGQWCYPLTVMDHTSRYLIGCEALKGPRLKETKAVFTRLFKEYGLPRRMRSDNGVPFASRSCGGLSQLSMWWIQLGIMPERIEPGKPQQNGRHERMHRTLKQAAVIPPSGSMRAQQNRFDRFCEEYNRERPHEALGQKTPSSLYIKSARPYPEKLAPITYLDYYEKKKISPNGTIYWRNKMVYISYILRGETVGLEEIDDGIWRVYFGPIVLGKFNELDKQAQGKSYLTVKV